MGVLVWRVKHKGGRGQGNRVEIGAGALLAASPLSIRDAPNKTAMLRRLRSLRFPLKVRVFGSHVMWSRWTAVRLSAPCV